MPELPLVATVAAAQEALLLEECINFFFTLCKLNEFLPKVFFKQFFDIFSVPDTILNPKAQLTTCLFAKTSTSGTLRLLYTLNSAHGTSHSHQHTQMLTTFLHNREEKVR